jgi:hypothetical protein
MSDINGRLLSEFAGLEPIYVDGIFTDGIMNLGATFATPYFRWTLTGHVNNGVIAMERQPALLLIRPRSSLLPHSPLAKLLDAQPCPKDAVSELRLLAH